jgi:hypothetical protein
VKNVIFSAMMELLPHLSAKLVDQLFDLVRRLPLPEYDLETLNFLVAFSTHAIKTYVSSQHPFFFFFYRSAAER